MILTYRFFLRYVQPSPLFSIYILYFFHFMNEFPIFSHLGFTYTTYITVKSEFLISFLFLFLSYYLYLSFFIYNILYLEFRIFLFHFYFEFRFKKSKEFET